MKQPLTIVLTGGGSGGHITPLLPLARELKKIEPDCRIVYIGNKGDKFDSLQLSAEFDFMAFIRSGKFRRYHGESLLAHLLDIKTLGLNARDFFKVLRSIGSALRLLRRFRPAVVFSKGGFVVVPVGVAARILGIPIVTHDSDTKPGLANRIIGRWAQVHATGMPAKYYPYPKSATVYTGIPISDNFRKVDSKLQQDYKKALGLGSSNQVLFVGGAGNGSRDINNLIIASAPNLLSANKYLHIIHISGQKHEHSVKQEYASVLPKEMLGRVSVLGFTPELYKYSATADIVVTRAGATTMAELATQAKACIVIPSPFLAGGHQMENAKELTQHDAAVILPNDVSAQEFSAVTTELLGNEKRRSELAKNLFKLAKPGAEQQIAKIIIQVAQGR